MSSDVRFKLICNPWDTQTSAEYSFFIDNMKATEEITVIVKELNNGYVKYDVNGPEKIIKDLYKLTENIRLKRVRLSMNVDMKSPLEFNDVEAVNSTAVTLVSKYLEIKENIGAFQKIFVPARSKNGEKSERIVVIYPYYIDGGEPIYETKSRLVELQHSANLNKWRGYISLPRDPLTRFSVEALSKRGLTVDPDQLVETEDLIMVRLKNMKTLGEFRTSINIQNQTFSQEGYCGVITSSMNATEIDVMDELVEMWGGTLEAEFDESRIYKITPREFINYSTQDFSLNLCDWLERSVTLIMEGKLPIIRVTGPWMTWNQRHSGGDKEDKLEKFFQLKSRLTYLAIRAYDQTASSGKEYLFQNHHVHVRDDLSINVSLSCRDDYNSFYNNMIELIPNLSEIESVRVNNEEDAAVVIWIVQKNIENPDFHPLGFNVSTESDCGNNSGSYVVLGIKDRERLNKKIPGDTEKTKIELRKLLLNDLKDCHEGRDIVTDEKISTMSLKELLDLVRLKQEKGDIVYCYQSTTIESLVSKIDPVSRKFISQEVLRRSTSEKFFGDEVIGLVSSGPLKGLGKEYGNSYLKTYLIKPPQGILSFRRIFETDMEAENILLEDIVGVQIQVNINYTDKTTAVLLVGSLEAENSKSTSSINDPKNFNEFADIVEKVWNCGFFLNIWAKSYATIVGKLSKYPTVNNDIVSKASNSIHGGKELMRYLTNIEKELCN